MTGRRFYGENNSSRGQISQRKTVNQAGAASKHTLVKGNKSGDKTTQVVASEP